MIEVTAAVIRDNGKFLICQRAKGKNCELLWEFPGGKIEPGETAEQCIVRECQEELGVTLEVEQKLTDIVYAYSDRTVHLHFFITRIVAGQLQRREHNAFAWVTTDEMSRYEFCPADTEMLNNYSQRIKVCEHS